MPMVYFTITKTKLRSYWEFLFQNFIKLETIVNLKNWNFVNAHLKKENYTQNTNSQGGGLRLGELIWLILVLAMSGKRFVIKINT